MHSASLVTAPRADGEALAADDIAETAALWRGTHQRPAGHADPRVVALLAGREWRVGLHERVIDFLRRAAAGRHGFWYGFRFGPVVVGPNG